MLLTQTAWGFSVKISEVERFGSTNEPIHVYGEDVTFSRLQIVVGTVSSPLEQKTLNPAKNGECAPALPLLDLDATTIRTIAGVCFLLIFGD